MICSALKNAAVNIGPERLSAPLGTQRTENNAILNRMKRKGSLMTADGGRTIVQELEYAENASAEWYSGYQTVNIAPSDVFSAAEFN